MIRLARATGALVHRYRHRTLARFLLQQKPPNADRTNYAMREKLIAVEIRTGRWRHSRVLLRCKSRHGIVVRKTRTHDDSERSRPQG